MTDAAANPEVGQGLLTRDAVGRDPRLVEQDIQRQLEAGADDFRQDRKTANKTRWLLGLAGIAAVAGTVLLGPPSWAVGIGALLGKFGIFAGTAAAGSAAATTAATAAITPGIAAGVGGLAAIGLMGAGLSNIGRGTRAMLRGA